MHVLKGSSSEHGALRLYVRARLSTPDVTQLGKTSAEKGCPGRRSCQTPTPPHERCRAWLGGEQAENLMHLVPVERAVEGVLEQTSHCSAGRKAARASTGSA